MARVGQRAPAAIRDAAVASPDGVVFRERVLDEIARVAPFDAGCLATADPASLVPTSLMTIGYDAGVYPTVVDIEYGPGDEPGRFESMRARPVPVRTLREATGGRVRSTRYYDEVLAPHGLRDEVRMIFRGSDGLAWGACTLARAGGRVFGDEEVAELGRLLADVGDGLRTTLFRTAVDVLPNATDGPAVAVVSADNELEAVTPAALEWFERLGWGPAGRPVAVAPAVVAAAALRRSGQASTVVRTRTRDGEWAVIRTGWHGPSGGSVVMTVEPAHLPEVASLAAVAHGLTRRETEVLAHLLAGQSREDMARSMVISPYTVQDHLRSIYAKTGTGGRRGLVALLVRTEYLPRAGAPVGADGWFAPSSGAVGPGSPGAPDGHDDAGSAGGGQWGRAPLPRRGGRAAHPQAG